MKARAIYRPVTDLERGRAAALAKCSFLPGHPAKRFALNIAAQVNGDHGITDKQAAMLEAYCWRYRRQVEAWLVPASNPWSSP